MIKETTEEGGRKNINEKKGGNRIWCVRKATKNTARSCTTARCSSTRRCRCGPRRRTATAPARATAGGASVRRPRPARGVCGSRCWATSGRPFLLLLPPFFSFVFPGFFSYRARRLLSHSYCRNRERRKGKTEKEANRSLVCF